MNTFRFLDFPVYKDAKQFYKDIILLTKSLPKEYHDLGNQIRRSALSISLNIAEGSAKRSDKDFNRYIENSLGSMSETIACLDIGSQEGLLSKERYAKLLSSGEMIAKQLGGLSKKLRVNS